MGALKRVAAVWGEPSFLNRPLPRDSMNSTRGFCLAALRRLVGSTAERVSFCFGMWDCLSCGLSWVCVYFVQQFLLIAPTPSILVVWAFLIRKVLFCSSATTETSLSILQG